MSTQFDGQLRAMNLNNLEALCAHVSGSCHRYEVSKISKSRVHVTYSNPDEYGNPEPITAVFPAIPGFDGAENPLVIVGQLLRVIGVRDGSDGGFAFDAITAGPTLHRKGLDGTWQTRREIHGEWYTCPDGVARKVDWNHPYTNDTFAAFEVTSTTPAEFFARRGGSRHWAYFTWSNLTPVPVE